MSQNLTLVAGGGGFIGGHLVDDLLEQGGRFAASTSSLSRLVPGPRPADNMILDLRRRAGLPRSARRASATSTTSPPTWAAWGSSRTTRRCCMLSVLINTHLLQAAHRHGARELLLRLVGLRVRRGQAARRGQPRPSEADAYPAMPEDGYGWEKLFSERMCRHFREDFGLRTRVARFHNVYGPKGTWRGGREKAPAAICRKVAEAKQSGVHEIEIWGDGEQTRSFMYIDDCVYGTQTIMAVRHPRADQPRQQRDGHDQPARRHRRGHRGDHARAPLRPLARRRACAVATATTR